MSDREKLIEKLRKWKLYFFRCVQCALKDNAHELGTLLGEAADYIEANGVTVQKWIPVSERLPDGECLAVSMLNGPAYKEMLIGYVGEASNWDTGYECESDGEILPNVTHWMSLPEPPKECE